MKCNEIEECRSHRTLTSPQTASGLASNPLQIVCAFPALFTDQHRAIPVGKILGNKIILKIRHKTAGYRDGEKTIHGGSFAGGHAEYPLRHK